MAEPADISPVGFLSAARDFVRSPLGIIGLFIGLIYGFASIFMIYAVTHLSAGNQDRIIWFLILFPVLVLATFTYLVVSHHWKLYAPQDHRTVGSFFGQQMSQKEVVDKLAAEVNEEARAVEQSNLSAGSADSETEATASSPTVLETPQFRVRAQKKPAGGISKRSKINSLITRSIKDAYARESLILDEISRRFNKSVRRNVKIENNGRSFEVDGVLEFEDNVHLFEIKSFPLPRGAISGAIDQLRDLVHSLQSIGRSSYIRIQATLVFVLRKGHELNDADRELLKNLNLNLPSNISIEVMSLNYSYDDDADEDGGVLNVSSITDVGI